MNVKINTKILFEDTDLYNYLEITQEEAILIFNFAINEESKSGLSMLHVIFSICNHGDGFDAIPTSRHRVCEVSKKSC